MDREFIRIYYAPRDRGLVAPNFSIRAQSIRAIIDFIHFSLALRSSLPCRSFSRCFRFFFLPPLFSVSLALSVSRVFT